MAILDYSMPGSRLAHRHHATTGENAENARRAAWNEENSKPLRSYAFWKNSAFNVPLTREHSTPAAPLGLPNKTAANPKAKRLVSKSEGCPHRAEEPESCLLVLQTDPDDLATTKLGLAIA